MPLHEATLKRQLDRAKEDLTAWIHVLDGKGLAATDRRKDARWRHLNSAFNTIRVRIKARAAVVSRDEEVAKHKIDRLAAAAAAATEEKAPKKAKEPKAKDKGAGKKADKGEKAPKAEKGGEPKEKKKKDKEKT